MGARAEPSTAVLAGVVACFVLSGFAALLYQTAWLRQFALVFGTSELAVATVLAAYMAGLALGAALAGRFIGRVSRPVWVYGFLEAGIAASALAVPLLLGLAGDLYVAFVGGRPAPPDAATLGQPFFYLVVGFLVLVVPTALMGATLPMLMRYAVQRDEELGPRVALLYAANTAGAVLGTLTAAFLLLPTLGLRGTVWVGVAVNLLVFVIAARLAGGSGDTAGAQRVDVATAMPPGFVRACLAPLVRGEIGAALVQQAGWVLPIMAVSGAVSFLYEVLWTRMLAYVVGGSIYAFATMLGAFLTGIALGGGLAGRLARTRTQAALAFAACQAGVALLSVGIYAWLAGQPPGGGDLGERARDAVLVMLPATLFIGATFPLAVRILARDEREASGATARTYSWNTLGAIFGSVLAAFVIIPALGFEGAVKLAVCTNLALALATLWLVAPRSTGFPVAVGLALLVALVAYRPGRPEALVASSRLAAGAVETFYAVGRSSTVTVYRADGFHHVTSNGLSEAAVAHRGAPPVQDAQQWMAALPVLARPDARRMLVVGLGGGVALEGVPPSVEAIDVVELEPEVLRANQSIADLRGRDPLADPRVRVVVNDARNALRLTDRTWDVIVSQPSHPWTAGASHLYTREFLASARSHLEPDGVFVQWMNSYYLEEDLLRSLAATLLSEFEHVRLYQPTPHVLVFLASAEPLEIEAVLARDGARLDDASDHYRRMGLNQAEDLVAALLMEGRGLARFAEGAEISTDDFNLMATRSRAGADGLRLDELLPVVEPHDPLLDPSSPIHRGLADAFRLDYVARRLIRFDQPGRARRMAATVADEATRQLVLGELLAAGGDLEGASWAFRAALAAEPGSMQARYQLVRSLRDDPGQAIEAARGLRGPARAVVRGWQLLAQEAWPSLRELDPLLARSRPTDAWFAEAARLRAAWRLGTTSDAPALASEALPLLDAAFQVADEETLFALQGLRARAALRAGANEAFVESVRDVVGAVSAHLDRAVRDRRSVAEPEARAIADDVLPLVEALAELDAGALELDAAALRADAAEVVARLERVLDGAATAP